ncbi:MAG: trehalase family glycosidase [Crocinitomicaceae bacterium]|nr:trehalase family glycosidase [Crocinitomicaceae bacterium]MDG1777176.1 trehalase family glycosidase [Crocinitomicaceae bacterium]
MYTKQNALSILLAISTLLACTPTVRNKPETAMPISNVLNYVGTPDSTTDRGSLSFSDQGAWFSYGLPEEKICGFTGPFLMTQSNGTWSSKCLSELILRVGDSTVNMDGFKHTTTSYLSHLENRLESDDLEIIQELFFATSNTSISRTRIFNKTGKEIKVQPIWKGQILDTSLSFVREENALKLNTTKSNTSGIIRFFEDAHLTVDSTQYSCTLAPKTIKAQNAVVLINTHSFNDKLDAGEMEHLNEITRSFSFYFNRRIKQKTQQQKHLVYNPLWADSVQELLGAKAILTLQNNWRSPSGELKHSGLFPSYHYKWFHGFWAWDSWKHSAALAHINPELAKDQLRAMYDFRTKDGFIPDCIFRDTINESHNYRNTKAPLSAWAVYEVFSTTRDTSFIFEMYPHLQAQHHWWYKNRDHDQDSICEYGSTDGTITAAKWESGMDNAVRFDYSTILKNKAGAFSLDQESVDLNAYLYAEKKYLAKLGSIIGRNANEKQYRAEARRLKVAIQNQFFDDITGWFYDTDLEGKNFIKIMGCEGWIPLWAKVASPYQANRVKENMMDKSKFNVLMPLQTLSADHPKFKPNRGYWRGPNWLDQSYFGVKGLYNYNFKTEAHKLATKLIYNAEGLLDKGPSIRENYHPTTGQGLEAKNFSWSAAHYLLLLMEK